MFARSAVCIHVTVCYSPDLGTVLRYIPHLVLVFTSGCVMVDQVSHRWLVKSRYLLI